MDRTDTSTRQHRDRQFRRHRHVDRNHVADTNVLRFQSVGELADFGFKFRISQRSGVAGFAFPNDRQFVSFAGFDLSVQAVVRNIGFPIDEPLYVCGSALDDFAKRLKPMKLILGDLTPEFFGVVFCSVIKFVVLVNRSND